MLGPMVSLIGGNHDVDYIDGPLCNAPSRSNDRGIQIENGVWIGLGAIILDGAIIREGSVIGAGAVVVGDLPPYSICVGIPAKPIRLRFTEERLATMLKNVKSSYSLQEVEQRYINITSGCNVVIPEAKCVGSD